MIGGVGIDIVGIARVQESIDYGDQALELVLKPEELDVPAPLIACELAAKEALIKASDKGNHLDPLTLRVKKNSIGNYYFEFDDPAQKFNGFLSVSLSSDYALAIVINLF